MKADLIEKRLKYRRALISLGSNTGCREALLARARGLLAANPGIRILRQSGILNNRALIVEDQPDFLNQIVEIETTLSPLECLRFMKKIELDLGRRQTFRYGPREIDLDILSYAGVRVESAELTLPHPALFTRSYLHQLLADLGEDSGSVEGMAGVVDETDP